MIVLASRLNRRRTELGLSRNGLAAITGLSDKRLRQVERADTELDVQQAADLARALGCTSSWLAGDGMIGAPPDTAVLGSTLLRLAATTAIPADAVAAGLQWSLPRVEAALADLDDQLRPAGLLVFRSRYGIAIRPLADVITDDQQAAIAAEVSKRDSLPVNHARMLHHIARGQPLPKALSVQDITALGALVNRGLVTRSTGSTAHLAQAVAASLLTDTWHEPWQPPAQIVPGPPQTSTNDSTGE